MKYLVALMLILAGCEDSSGVNKNETTGDWTHVGSTPTLQYSGHVYWTTNKENGDRIYVLIGDSGRGGIYVIPKVTE